MLPNLHTVWPLGEILVKQFNIDLIQSAHSSSNIKVIGHLSFYSLTPEAPSGSVDEGSGVLEL